MKTVILQVSKLLKIFETAGFLRYFNNQTPRMLRYLWLWPVIFIMIQPLSLVAQRHRAIQTIVIDAGHGGHDPGAIGQHAREKNLNLAIALKLGSQIQRSMKDVRVIYTRDKDFFVELYRRAEIANENKADMFICIHCNANKNHARKGAETYVMGLDKSQANLNIAKVENASILLESDYQSTYNGFDPNADESYIIFSLFQNSNLDQSTDFAAAIQEQFEKHQKGSIHGVRQAGFMVLYKTTMPSVLVETGYISNPEEEFYLMSDQGQDHIVSAICRALKNFRESVANPANQHTDTAQPASIAPQTIADGHVKVVDTTSVIKQPEREVKSAVKPTSGSELSYKVQIAASIDKLEANDSRLVKFSNPQIYRHNGMYKYTIGDESTLRAAEKLLDEAWRKGAADAFIVIFRNGSRIPQDEAKRLLNKK